MAIDEATLRDWERWRLRQAATLTVSLEAEPAAAAAVAQYKALWREKAAPPWERWLETQLRLARRHTARRALAWSALAASASLGIAGLFMSLPTATPGVVLAAMGVGVAASVRRIARPGTRWPSDPRQGRETELADAGLLEHAHWARLWRPEPPRALGVLVRLGCGLVSLLVWVAAALALFRATQSWEWGPLLAAALSIAALRVSAYGVAPFGTHVGQLDPTTMPDALRVSSDAEVRLAAARANELEDLAAHAAQMLSEPGVAGLPLLVADADRELALESQRRDDELHAALRQAERSRWEQAGETLSELEIEVAAQGLPVTQGEIGEWPQAGWISIVTDEADDFDRVLAKLRGGWLHTLDSLTAVPGLPVGPLPCVLVGTGSEPVLPTWAVAFTPTGLRAVAQCPTCGKVTVTQALRREIAVSLGARSLAASRCCP